MANVNPQSVAELVAAFEAREPGQPWAVPLAEAEAANAELGDGARAKLFFVEITPKIAGCASALDFYTRRFPGGSAYGSAMAALHGRTLRGHGDLAQLIRSAEVVSDVAAAAATQAAVLNRPAHELAAEAIARFELEIARQLAAAADHELAPAARDLLAAEALGQRLSATKARHEEHAHTELRRVQEERHAVERSLAAAAARAAQEATAEAARADVEARQAQERARRAAGEELARRLRASGRKVLRPNAAEVFDVQELAAAVPGMAIETIARFTAALARAGA